MTKKTTRKDVKGTCYLIHFDSKFSHAQHYVGWTEREVEERLAEHKSGQGSKLLKHVAAAGIGFSVVKTWPNTTRAFERKLHNLHGSASICPVCKAEHGPRINGVHKTVMQPGTVVKILRNIDWAYKGEFGTVVCDNGFTTTVRVRGLNIPCWRSEVAIVQKRNGQFPAQAAHLYALQAIRGLTLAL